MAVEAVHALASVQAHLVFVDYRILQPRMTLGAFARRAHQLGVRLFGFHRGTRPVDQKRRQDQGEGNYDRHKD